jgi:hypothetical protein
VKLYPAANFEMGRKHRVPLSGPTPKGGNGSMRQKSSRTIRRVASLLLLLATLGLLMRPSSHAVAEELLGLYVGGAIGQSRVVEAADTKCDCDLDPGTIVTEEFDKTHLAFQVALGVRPISLLGAEIDYIDLGKPHAVANTFPESASINGLAAFGFLYLPVPVVDIYLKAGVARLNSTLRFSYCGPCSCNPCLNTIQLNHTNTSGVGGIGAQYKFGKWAVRTEYERFNAAGGHPSLLSAGVTWSFL